MIICCDAFSALKIASWLHAALRAQEGGTFQQEQWRRAVGYRNWLRPNHSPSDNVMAHVHQASQVLCVSVRRRHRQYIFPVGDLQIRMLGSSARMSAIVQTSPPPRTPPAREPEAYADHCKGSRKVPRFLLTIISTPPPPSSASLMCFGGFLDAQFAGKSRAIAAATTPQCLQTTSRARDSARL